MDILITVYGATGIGECKVAAIISVIVGPLSLCSHIHNTCKVIRNGIEWARKQKLAGLDLVRSMAFICAGIACLVLIKQEEDVPCRSLHTTWAWAIGITAALRGFSLCAALDDSGGDATDIEAQTERAQEEQLPAYTTK